MHICDGILDPRICIGGYALAAGLAAAALKKVNQKDIPKISVIGAAFFVSSLIHFRIGFSSVHLTFIGLVGIILGFNSVLAIITGLFFQAVMFQHGGLSTLGVNSVIFSIPALVVFGIFNVACKKVKKNSILSIIAAVLAGMAIILALICVIFVLYSTGEELAGFAYLFSISHGVLALVEGIVTYIVILQILKTKPQMIEIFKRNRTN